MIRAACLMLVLASLASALTAHDPPAWADNGPYRYDEAAKTLETELLTNPNFYDPDTEIVGMAQYVTWLEFVPGEGDRLWLGLRSEGVWIQLGPVEEEPGRLSRPTLTADSRRDIPLISYEARAPGMDHWGVYVREGITTEAPARLVSTPGANAIRHATATDPNGGVWIAWQQEVGGQWDIHARRLPPGKPPEEIQRVSASSHGDWHPSITALRNGTAIVAWDRFDGESFDVVCRRRVGKRWAATTLIADGPAFQGRVQLASGGPSTWVLWEEGAEAWGAPYRSEDGKWNNVTDTYGPLHRFRKLRLAALNSNGGISKLAPAFPMPSITAAYARKDNREGVREMGVFYERGELMIDRLSRPWVVYRHYSNPQIGRDEPVEHHVEKGWKVYARCLDGKAWSPLYALDVPQRDGMQRASITPWLKGLRIVYATGRTDRRKDQGPRGIAMATVQSQPTHGGAPRLLARAPVADASEAPAPEPPTKTRLGGKDRQLFFGDLHRHTDLSLCFPYFDGSLDDAYRYATEVAGLDFLGITDHTRDIARGDALSQLWWRSVKEVERHRLKGTFFPFFSYERSHKDTDHNVISLRHDILRNYPPPLPEFWDEIDADTFTIPHRPFIGKVWEHHHDDKRPLLEIYQGLRDKVSAKHAHEGLDKGHHLGFIASSDHMSTGASFACVWSPAADREAIFRSMQARRTYGATAKIELIFRSGDHWMGERIETNGETSFEVRAKGTAPFTWVDVYVDGKKERRLEPDGGSAVFDASFRLEPFAEGAHYVYVHLMQDDGNQAWSSPIWLE